jgi:hypothetical protein
LKIAFTKTTSYVLEVTFQGYRWTALTTWDDINAVWKAIEAESQKTDGSFPDEDEDPAFHNMKTCHENVTREVKGFHTGRRQLKRSAAQHLISAYIKHVFKQSRFVRPRKFKGNTVTMDG